MNGPGIRSLGETLRRRSFHSVVSNAPPAMPSPIRERALLFSSLSMMTDLRGPITICVSPRWRR